MFTEDADFSYTEFPIEDKHTGQPSQYFRDAFNVLSEVRDNKSVALVHCTTGKNIAPTIVLAHMIVVCRVQGEALIVSGRTQTCQGTRHQPRNRPISS